MRVAYVSRGVFVSGAERSLQTLLCYAPDAGIEPVVVCMPGDKLIPWLVEEQIPYRCTPLALRDRWHPIRWWSSVRAMRAVLRELRTEVVHTNQMWSYPPAGAAARALRLPRVCHLRDEAPMDTLRWLCKSGVEAVVCISSHIARQAERAWPTPSDRPLIETIVNPVVLPDRSQVTGPTIRRQARIELGVDSDAVFFGFIGQIVPVKGVLELLDAVAGLDARPPWQLLVAGRDPNPGAPYEKLCRARAEQLGLSSRVRFIGFQENVARFYEAIDVAVVPSLEEPLGRVPLEAGAYAKPSIAFATGGLPETIRHGETGWLVPRGNTLSLRCALAKYLEEPIDKWGLEARRWVELAADPKRYVARLAELYRQLLEDSNRRPSAHGSDAPTIMASCR